MSESAEDWKALENRGRLDEFFALGVGARSPNLSVRHFLPGSTQDRNDDRATAADLAVGPLSLGRLDATLPGRSIGPGAEDRRRRPAR